MRSNWVARTVHVLALGSGVREKEISPVTYNLARQELTDTHILELIEVLLPCFSYSFDHTAQLELQVKVRLSMIINDMIEVSLIENNLLSLNFQTVWLNR